MTPSNISYCSEWHCLHWEPDLVKRTWMLTEVQWGPEDLWATALSSLSHESISKDYEENASHSTQCMAR